MWYLVALVSLYFSGIPTGAVVAIVIALIAGVTKSSSWLRTAIIWLIGMIIGAWIFRAYELGWDMLWHFVGAVIGSGVIVWLVHWIIHEYFSRRAARLAKMT